MTRPAPKGHVLVAIMTYRHTIDVRVMQAVEQAMFGLMNIGWLGSPLIGGGHADVAGGRNTLLGQFYAAQAYTDILYVDSDVSWEPGTIERLMSHPVDCVLGAYPRRAEGGLYSVRTLPGPCTLVDPVTGETHPHGLLEVAAGPAGMLRLSRRCVETMVNAYPDTWYSDPLVSSGKTWNLFEFTVQNHERVSEDITFCLRYRNAGGRVWCDPHPLLHHHGDKTYSGRFLDHLKSMGRLTDPKKVQKITLDAIQKTSQ